MTPLRMTKDRAMPRSLAGCCRFGIVAFGLVIGLSACISGDNERQPVVSTETATATASAGPSTTAKNSQELSRDRALVANLQRQLKFLGFDPGPIDGLFGPRTAATIKAYQKANGRPSDGQISEALIAELAQDAALEAADAMHSATPVDRRQSVSRAVQAEIKPRSLPGSLYIYSDGSVLDFSDTKAARRRATPGEVRKGQPPFIMPPTSWAESDGAAKTNGWRCRRDGRANLRVAAGRFDTEKLVCDRHDKGGAIALTRTWFYAPVLRHYVRRIDAPASGRVQPPVDLVAIEPAVRDWPPAAQAGLLWATQHALDSLPVGKEQPWRSSAVEASVNIRPGRKITTSGKTACRRYLQIWTVEQEEWIFPTVACRDPSGAWAFPGLPEVKRLAAAESSSRP